MTKKQLRQAGYQAIVKEKKSHQEAFDEIIQLAGVDPKRAAEELSKIPSNGKQKTTTSLRYAFIGALAWLILMRILGISYFALDGSINLGALSIVLLIGLIVPVLGIYAALFSKTEYYTTTGILLSISLFRTITRGEFGSNPEYLIGMIPFVMALALAFYIPTKLKTPFKRSERNHFIDGKSTTTVTYTFEDSRVNESDLLDSRF